MQLSEQLFIGNEIRRAAEDFAALRISVFYDFPYLYEGTLEYELEYIQTYAQSPNALLFGIYDGEKMVGATTCVPMEEETDDVKAPFEANGLNVNEYLYFGESIILPAYRGLGYGKRFFEIREQQAKDLGKTKTCFCSVDRPIDHPLKPENYRDNGGLWTKMGYTEQRHLSCEMKWLDRNETEETSKRLIFWTKEL